MFAIVRTTPDGEYYYHNNQFFCESVKFAKLYKVRKTAEDKARVLSHQKSGEYSVVEVKDG